MPERRVRNRRAREQNLNRPRLAARHVGQRVVVWCNGEVTETNYFEDLRRDKRLHSLLVVEGRCEMNACLVSKLREDIERDSLASDTKYYVVFDVDALGHPDRLAKVESAIALCGQGDIKITPIISNECFELWFLLHYAYLDTHIHRSEIADKVTERIGESYRKDTPMYHRLKDKQSDAIRNAKTLYTNKQDISQESQRAPYTKVHELVEFLNSLAVAIQI